MNATQIGLVVGLILGIAVANGVLAFLVACVCGVIGVVAAYRIAEGTSDLSGLVNRIRGR
jgi:hypothetical protein